MEEVVSLAGRAVGFLGRVLLQAVVDMFLRTALWALGFGNLLFGLLLFLHLIVMFFVSSDLAGSERDFLPAFLLPYGLWFTGLLAGRLTLLPGHAWGEALMDTFRNTMPRTSGAIFGFLAIVLLTTGVQVALALTAFAR